MTIILNAGDTVRAAAWSAYTTATVGTVEQFALNHQEDVEVALNRAARYGHELAWTLLPPSILTSDRAYNARKIAEAKAKVARAVVLAAGDEVTIEGRLYTVRFPQNQDRKEYPNLADPIHFVPAAR